MIAAGGPELVESSYRVDKPDAVMRFIFFIEFEIRIARGWVKGDVGFRIPRSDYCLLKAHFFAMARPVCPFVTVIPEEHDGLCRIKIMHAARQVLFVPVLRRDRTYIRSGRPVLVIGH